MDSYKRNRLIGLGVIGVIVVIAAGYFFLVMTADNTRRIESPEAETSFSVEISGPFNYTIFNLPVGYSKYRTALDDISLFASFDPDYVLSRLPKKIENIVFSPDGQKAVVFESDKISFYDVAENSMSEIITLEGGWGSGVFFNDNYYTIGYDETSKKDALKVVNLENGEVGDLVYFIRDIKDYELMASLESAAVFMVDKTSQPNILYVIDTAEASRENIYEDNYIELVDITGDGLLVAFKAGENQFQSILNIFDTQTKDFFELPYEVRPGNFVFANDGFAYFVSDSIKGDNTTNINELLSSYADPKTITLYKWDVFDQTSQEVDLNELSAIPDRIEIQGDVVRMLVEEEYFDVKVAELI